jgi:8-oxo-dGTP pyrophosphatase MutT (NUDIX family)
MERVKSCGVLVVREAPRRSFLLMKHARRYDLPKGHMNSGESEIECALRELFEETGIRRDEIELDPAFRHEEKYETKYARFGSRFVEKTLVIFLGRLLKDRPIVPSEHMGYEWVDWSPPHRIQTRVIDGLLAEVAAHLADPTTR